MTGTRLLRAALIYARVAANPGAANNAELIVFGSLPGK
jgi:hypothetical protein